MVHAEDMECQSLFLTARAVVRLGAHVWSISLWFEDVQPCGDVEVVLYEGGESEGPLWVGLLGVDRCWTDARYQQVVSVQTLSR